ncbi:glycosyltransferase [Candidatus Dojkabacteria bacterium]|nr:glycosyltransferase [Candidatus Dojkabacteria bacterium]
MVRIVYVITGLQKGGAEMQLVKLLKYWPRKQEILVIAFRPGPLENELRKMGISTMIFPIFSMTNALTAMKKTLQVLTDYRPNIVHSWLTHANILMKFLRIVKNFKLVTSIRVKEKRYLSHVFLERILDPFANCVVVNSVVVKEYLCSCLFDKNKIEVVPNIVELKPIKRKHYDRLKKKYRGKKVVLTVANFREQKDYRTNVQVCEKVMKKHQNVVFLYAGDGTERSKIQEIVKKKGLQDKICFLGTRSDIPELLEICDVFFLPTLYEGQSNALLEAYTHGCKIVSTNIPENLELGITATFCRKGDSDAMAKEILRLIRGRTNGNEEYQAKMKKHQAKRVGKIYMEIYSRILQCVG